MNREEKTKIVYEIAEMQKKIRDLVKKLVEAEND